MDGFEVGLPVGRLVGKPDGCLVGMEVGCLDGQWSEPYLDNQLVVQWVDWKDLHSVEHWEHSKVVKKERQTVVLREQLSVGSLVHRRENQLEVRKEFQSAVNSVDSRVVHWGFQSVERKGTSMVRTSVVQWETKTVVLMGMRKANQKDKKSVVWMVYSLGLYLGLRTVE
jgi:hypothetical protein